MLIHSILILQNSWNGRRYVVKCNWINILWVVANVASGGIHFSRYLASLSCQWVQSNSWNPASADDTYTYNTHVTILFHLAFTCWSPSTKNRNWTFGFRVAEAFQFSLLHDNTKLHARIVVYSSNYQHIYTHQSLYVCTKLYSYNYFIIIFFIILSVLWWFKLLFRVDFSKVFWYLMKYYWMNYVWVFWLLGIIQFWIICL